MVCATIGYTIVTPQQNIFLPLSCLQHRNSNSFHWVKQTFLEKKKYLKKKLHANLAIEIFIPCRFWLMFYYSLPHQKWKPNNKRRFRPQQLGRNPGFRRIPLPLSALLVPDPRVFFNFLSAVLSSFPPLIPNEFIAEALYLPSKLLRR